MSNVIKAITHLIKNPIINLTSFYSAKNRVNAVGNALEQYIKDLFANTLMIDNEYEKIQKYNEIFSYGGNQNNPPDFILRNGDAIEVKKVEGVTHTLSLNSSYPKAKLFANSSMITEACKNCEKWQEKDILYIIGNVNKGRLIQIWFIYGDCYAANAPIYERIKNTISGGLYNIPNIELTETNELGKVKKVDPLGITDLRIRGMWSILHPTRVFDYLPKININSSFRMYCIMKEEKYNSFLDIDKSNLSNLMSNEFKISDYQIQNPNNPVDLINIKFMEFYHEF